MATEPVIDFDVLLQEIPGDNPAGADLSATGLFAELNELRREDEGGDLGGWELKETKTANWSKLVKVATETLASKSKDLRVAAHLCEALVQQHGMAGLRDGLKLMRQLQEKFWDNLYPSLVQREDEDSNGLEMRAAGVGRIDRLLPLPVQRAAVTKSKVAATVFSTLDWERAENLEHKIRPQSQQAYDEEVAAGAPTGEGFHKAVIATPRSFYEGFVADMDEASGEIDALNKDSEARYGEAEEIPYLTELSKAMVKVNQMLSVVEKSHGPLRVVAKAEEAAVAEEGVRAFTGDGIPLQPRDREDALQRLRSVAGYFRKAEPHSPVTYLVERAIAWAAMPLDQWLAEIVKDEASLAHIRETLGVRPGEQG